MGIKQKKPVTPGQRGMTVYDFEELTTDEPYKPLTEPKKQKAGRDHKGHISVRHRGGGHKRRYRIIDFKRDKDGIPGKVVSIEYDPNRSARICLISYADGEKRYILWPEGLKVGDVVMSGPDAPIRVGNCLPLEKIPVGTEVHNIELTPGRGGQLVRAAGTAAVILAKEGKYAHIRLPSGEIRLINLKCRATIGRVGLAEHSLIKLGKAGRSRWLGIRPTVRGKAMNVDDHPHGGGEGRCPVGRKYPVSPWGKIAIGGKTRRNRKTDKFIIQRRK